MFHGRPINSSTTSSGTTSSSNSGYPFVQQQQQQPQQQQQTWPLNQQDFNNLRASQSGVSTPVNVQVKFYLPDDEIRRSHITTNCTLQQVTEQIKRYASVADKDIVLAWNDDQNEWIRFDTDSEWSDAMNHARHLLSVGGVFKIQAKEGKTPKKQQQQPVEPVKQPEQKPITQPVQSPVTQPPVTQPPVSQPPVTQPVQPKPPVQNPVMPMHPINPPFQPYPQPPFRVQPPVMAFNQPQPQLQPMMNQPMSSVQPLTNSNNMPVPRNASPFGTPNKTLTNSVTMQQPHPLNSSFGSTVVQSPFQSTAQQVQQQPQQQPQQPTGAVDPKLLADLRNFGFPVDDSVLIKALQDANGDISVAADKILSGQ